MLELDRRGPIGCIHVPQSNMKTGIFVCRRVQGKHGLTVGNWLPNICPWARVSIYIYYYLLSINSYSEILEPKSLVYRGWFRPLKSRRIKQPICLSVIDPE